MTSFLASKILSVVLFLRVTTFVVVFIFGAFAAAVCVGLSWAARFVWGLSSQLEVVSLWLDHKSGDMIFLASELLE